MQAIQTEVTEDRKLISWGNVFSQDEHDQQGKVTNPGIHKGSYGVLTLLPNGSYLYVLNNLSSRVQSLGADETAIEEFSYSTSIGGEHNSHTLEVLIHGTNDAPLLARRLGNVQLARGKTFAWQVPEQSFIDLDANDNLEYSATLSNGQALPEWLSFDADTRTFSGQAPDHLSGKLAVSVSVTDGQADSPVASDSFNIRLGEKTVLPKTSPLKGGLAGLLEGVGKAVTPGALAGVQAHAQPDPHTAQDNPLADFLHNLKPASSPLPATLPGMLPNPSGREPASEQSLDSAFAQQWQRLSEALQGMDAQRQSLPEQGRFELGGDISPLGGLASTPGAWGNGLQTPLSLTSDSTRLNVFAGLRDTTRPLTG